MRELVRTARYSGYRRLLDRMAVGLLTTEQLMDTDPGAALVTWVAYLHRLAGRIRRQQKLRIRQWELHQAEAQHTSRPLPLTPDLSRGMGARLDALERTKKREQLLEMALGVFDAAGVVRLRLHREADVSSVGDLLVYTLDELAAVAVRKGGIRRLLDEKWAKVYQVNRPHGLFPLRHIRRPAPPRALPHSVRSCSACEVREGRRPRSEAYLASASPVSYRVGYSRQATPSARQRSGVPWRSLATKGHKPVRSRSCQEAGSR